jgi:hypothetical protein
MRVLSVPICLRVKWMQKAAASPMMTEIVLLRMIKTYYFVDI